MSVAIHGIQIEFTEDMWRHLNERLNITDCSENGQCSNCGQCCNNLLPLNFQEIERIRKFVKKHNVQPCAHFAPYSEFAGDMICPFRDSAAKRCTIYPVRPKICRTFFCGDPKEKIAAEREATYRRCSMEVDMRATFFGSDNDG